jgi:hypothetical protein
MLQVTKIKELPSRELERLLEFCQGLANQNPDAELKPIIAKVRKYSNYMKLGPKKIKIIEDWHRAMFKIGQSHDTYFTIDQINN